MTKPMSPGAINNRLAAVGAAHALTFKSVDADCPGGPVYTILYRETEIYVGGMSGRYAVDASRYVKPETCKTFAEAVAAAVVAIDTMIACTMTQEEQEKIVAEAYGFQYLGGTPNSVTVIDNISGKYSLHVAKVLRGDKTIYMTTARDEQENARTNNGRPDIVRSILDGRNMIDQLRAARQIAAAREATRTAISNGGYSDIHEAREMQRTAEAAAEPQAPTQDDSARDEAISAIRGPIDTTPAECRQYWAEKEQKQQVINQVCMALMGIGILILLVALGYGLFDPAAIGAACMIPFGRDFGGKLDRYFDKKEEEYHEPAHAIDNADGADGEEEEDEIGQTNGFKSTWTPSKRNG